ncbi:DUF397 domain-containing protein [Streptomyces fenghuangensis]|uniref:DUF397 domain-containing protein n=1 Tax=Streptomyces chitinivorans TaxID=1257027 RepID=A0ABW7HQE8_9ACTN|nr:DUF397 domain-containing protein [Streptomyces chitinivorans]MDH2412255.1 DUF397 domain-containing protein [Streptomyces chitinivorans]
MSAPIQWQKSSFSGGGGENCVEVARRGDDVLIRESDEPGLVLAASRAGLAAFIEGIKAGEFDRFAH